MEKCKYEGTGIWNGRCVGTKEVDPCPGYDKCKKYKPNYTTNAERIRAMSDEELLELFMFDTPCEIIVNSGNCLGSPCNCRECILGWLRQQAE